MPAGRGLKEAAILGRMGFQSWEHLGALSTRLMEGFRTWMAACSVRSRWALVRVEVRMRVSFQSMMCPDVLMSCRDARGLTWCFQCPRRWRCCSCSRLRVLSSVWWQVPTILVPTNSRWPAAHLEEVKHYILHTLCMIIIIMITCVIYRTTHQFMHFKSTIH